MKLYKDLSKEEKTGLLRVMLTSRYYEERVEEMNSNGYIHGTIHLAIGQEANHAGVSSALRDDDWIIGTHRGHGHYIAKGGDPLAMLAEIAGLSFGTSAGLSGSMRLFDLEHHNIGGSAIVGGSLPLAVGMAKALKHEGSDSIVTAFLGDGAMNQGMSMESFNLAEVWEAPVLFYCENNHYAISSKTEDYTAALSLKDRARSFGIRCEAVDGNDVTAVYDCVARASEYVREEKRPFFIESSTYRWKGHSRSDRDLIRSEEEINYWKSRCPIVRYENYLTDNGIMTGKEISDMQEEILSKSRKDMEKCLNSMKDVTDFATAYAYSKGNGGTSCQG